MAGETTLIVTTRSGVRPLGVRGEPRHSSAPQLRRVERSLAAIRRLGDQLAGAGPREDMGLVGLSLQLAARAPAESFIFVVGERPVIVCWGYEKEAATALLPVTPPPPPVNPNARRAVLGAPPPRLPATRPPSTIIPWGRTLLAALPLLLLLLAGAWLLRGCLPAEPDMALATREGPPAAAAPEPAPDPKPALKAAFSTEESRSRVLKVELSLIEAELKKRIADCKPPEAPKPPPQVALAPQPQPPPAPKPAPAPTPPPQQSRPTDDRLRLPSAPTNNYSFLSGCWRTDPFRHETIQMQPGISSYCFDANGNGQLEWRRGRTACRTRAQARFEGAVLRLRDGDTTCNDGSHWYADQLVCRRGADDVAQCSGSSRGAFGPVSWTVNLHKLN